MREGQPRFRADAPTPAGARRGLGRTFEREEGGEILSPAYVNGVLGVVGEREGRLTLIGVLDIADDLVRAVHIVLNPEKLACVRRA